MHFLFRPQCGDAGALKDKRVEERVGERVEEREEEREEERVEEREEGGEGGGACGCPVSGFTHCVSVGVDGFVYRVSYVSG